MSGNIIGQPLIIVPYKPPGCIDRGLAFLGRWLVRLALIGVGFLCGYACQMGQ